MRTPSLQIGALLPTRGVLFAENGPPDVSPILIMAERAEEAGFHSVWVGDSITAKPRYYPLAVSFLELGLGAAVGTFWHKNLRIVVFRLWSGASV
jgi:hypothetical protein